MRALFVSDAIGPLTSAQAGEVLAGGWAGADVRVLPVGTSAAGFTDAYADLLGVTVEQAMAGELLISTARSAGAAVVHVSGPAFGPGIPYAATSRPIGEAIAAVLHDGVPEQLVVDLGGLGSTTAVPACWRLSVRPLIDRWIWASRAWSGCPGWTCPRCGRPSAAPS